MYVYVCVCVCVYAQMRASAAPARRRPPCGNLTRRRVRNDFACFVLRILKGVSRFSAKLRKTYVWISSIGPNLRKSPQNVREKRGQTTQKIRA